MKRFARLLSALAFAPQRTAKLRLLQDYFAEAPDPARGYALAALTDSLEFRHAKPGLIRGLVRERADPVLFELSYDYVGDLAETVALMWPAEGGEGAAPALPAIVETLMTESKARLPRRLEAWLDALDPDGRWALLKLITGGLRVGVSARLAKTALAQYGKVDPSEIEELWFGLKAPYADLFAWLEGRGPRPDPNLSAAFRPVMLAQPIDATALEALDPADFAAEWKWDGARVQVVGNGRSIRVFARSGDDVSAAFPDIAGHEGFSATLDGEVLVVREGVVRPFGDLQRRLNRKTVSARLLEDYPVIVRCYDLLFENAEDLRPQPFRERRRRLERWLETTASRRFDLSALVDFTEWEALARARREAVEPGVEGVMLKRWDSAYVAGRPKGPWFKWKRDPHLADCVLMYAQRGHGKRSSYYSDYTFGVWRDGELVPVGKAYFGFTDEELVTLDRWVRDHTLKRHGPVREVERGLVLEVAFEGLQPSNRHKAGLAMRFPRIHRIRWDKPAKEADELMLLQQLLDGPDRDT